MREILRISHSDQAYGAGDSDRESSPRGVRRIGSTAPEHTLKEAKHTMAEEILLKDAVQKKFDLEELYQLQEAVFFCKDYDEIIRIVETFPQAKSPSARTPARHLINILWGFHMELEALTALKDKGYKAEFVEDDRHRFLHDGYDDYDACDIRITEGDRKGDYDVAGWTSFQQYQTIEFLHFLNSLHIRESTNTFYIVFQLIFSDKFCRIVIKMPHNREFHLIKTFIY